MTLIRALIPSWRFFDRLGEPTLLLYRLETGPWVRCLEAPRRTGSALFLNARGNFLSAAQSLVERLADEADESLGEDSVTYRLVRELVLREIPAPPGTFRYQFKLTQAGDLLISPLYEHAGGAR